MVPGYAKESNKAVTSRIPRLNSLRNLPKILRFIRIKASREGQFIRGPVEVLDLKKGLDETIGL